MKSTRRATSAKQVRNTNMEDKSNRKVSDTSNLPTL